MVRNEMLRRRAGTRVIVPVVWALIAGAQAGTPSSIRVLHFPQDQYMGSLYSEDPCLGTVCMELGRDLSLPYGLSPRGLALAGDWDFVALAQGDAAVPAGRNIQLRIMLGHRKEDARRLAALPPRQYEMFGRDRCREDPLDLSGLSALEPNDLYCLSVSNLVSRTDADTHVLRPIRHLTGLQILKLYKTGATDKGMEYLRDLRSLRALEFNWETSVKNEGLAALRDLPSLEYLDLGTGTADAGFKYLGQLRNLRWLRVWTGRIWGPGLAELAKLPRLEGLCFTGTANLSNRHIQYLEGATQIKSLAFWGVADRLTDASLASIGKLENLEELYFMGWGTAPRFTPAGVAHLKNLKRLRKIDFAATWTGPQGVLYGDDVARQLAGVGSLESIRGISYLSAEGMKTLATLPNLKCLHLALKDPRQGYDGPTGLSYLAELGTLEELAFTGGKSFSDTDLVYLESLGSLRHLLIGFDGATDRDMISLGRLRRLEHLTISLGHTATTTKQGLNELKNLTDLQTLQVTAFLEANAKPAIDEIPLNLSSLRSLKTLILSGMDLKDADLTSLAGLGDLEWLALDGSFTENGLWRLSGLDSLKFMSIDSLSCSSGEGLAHLAGFPRIGDLHLRGQITDGALAQVTGSSSLWSFSVATDEPIRRETIDRLKQTLPNVEYIHIDKLTPDAQPPIRSRPTRQRPRRRR